MLSLPDFSFHLSILYLRWCIPEGENGADFLRLLLLPAYCPHLLFVIRDKVEHRTRGVWFKKENCP